MCCMSAGYQSFRKACFSYFVVLSIRTIYTQSSLHDLSPHGIQRLHGFSTAPEARFLLHLVHRVGRISISLRIRGTNRQLAYVSTLTHIHGLKITLALVCCILHKWSEAPWKSTVHLSQSQVHQVRPLTTGLSIQHDEARNETSSTVYYREKHKVK